MMNQNNTKKIFNSILDRCGGPVTEARMPSYFEDLNLDQVIKDIQEKFREYPITHLYCYFPKNERDEEYRQGIYADVKLIYGFLEQYVNEMLESRAARENKDEVALDCQAEIWHLWEVYHYCHALMNLYQSMLECELQSEGFLLLKEYLNEYTSTEAFQTMYQKTKCLIDELLGFRMVLNIEDIKVTVSVEKTECEYEKFLKTGFPECKKQLRNPFAGSLLLSDLEQELLESFQKLHKKFFLKLKQFCKQHPVYEDKVLKRFESEIVYYLAFYRYEEKLKSQGLMFCVPTTEKEKKFCADGLYDLALASRNVKYNRETVGNRFEYDENEKFLIVTGPNQGGKTTFARSLGQLVYFSKMGFDVPAVSANVHYFRDILTHFSVEESMETGSGKLKEELQRLSPMMQQSYGDSFVIINELFTTAANYDACIMGKRVLKHFIERNCRGVYVTHLKELAEDDVHVVSMKALLDENDYHKRTYKIVRSKAEDIAYAGDLAEKYNLTYELLKNRFMKKGGED